MFSQTRALQEAEGEKQSSSKLFQRCLLPLSATSGLWLGGSLDKELLRPSCSDLVLLGQTLVLCLR